MFPKDAITETPIHPTLAQRWSGRAFDPNRAVEAKTLIQLFEAARWSPSASNQQPWRLTVWDRNEDFQQWSRAFECLTGFNRTWACHAPLLMLAAAETTSSEGKPNRWAPYDCGAAMMSLSVEATALGLMVHQMGGFDRQAIQQAFELPESYEPMSVLAVGYQLPEGLIPKDLEEREFAERTRKPLESLIFKGSWGRPFR